MDVEPGSVGAAWQTRAAEWARWGRTPGQDVLHRELLDGYFDEHRVSLPVERSGIEMTFEAIDRPLETYTSALAAAGFVIEELREPRPAADSLLAAARSRPFFLHLRCRREGA